jgi:hypothetical protein
VRLGNCSDLARFTKAGDPDSAPAIEPNPYSRFWHGYQVITRPSLAVGGTSLATTAGACFFLLASALLGLALWKVVGLPSVIFSAVLLMGLDLRELMSNSMQSIAMGSILLTGVLAALAINKRASHRFILMFIAGVLAGFLTMLFNQAAWLPLIVMLEICRPYRITWRVTGKNVAISAFGWLAGFFYANFTRAISRLAFEAPGDVVRDYVTSAKSRTVGTTQTNIVGFELQPSSLLHFLGNALTRNIDEWQMLGVRPALVAVSTIVLTLAAIVASRRAAALVRQASLIATGVLGMGLLLEHSWLHSIFTFRLIPVVLAGCSLIAAVELSRFSRQSSMSRKRGTQTESADRSAQRP